MTLNMEAEIAAPNKRTTPKGEKLSAPPRVVRDTPNREQAAHRHCRVEIGSFRKIRLVIRPKTGMVPIITPEKEVEVMEIP